MDGVFALSILADSSDDSRGCTVVGEEAVFLLRPSYWFSVALVRSSSDLTTFEYSDPFPFITFSSSPLEAKAKLLSVYFSLVKVGAVGVGFA